MLELAVLPAGAVLLTLGVYELIARTAESDGPRLSTFTGCVFAVVFAAVVGGALWSDDAAHHAAALVPTLGTAAGLGVRSGLRKRKHRPAF